MVQQNKPTGIEYKMDGKKYPVIAIYRSTFQTAQPLPGKILFHITARHKKHGLFSVACHDNELIGLKRGVNK